MVIAGVLLAACGQSSLASPSLTATPTTTPDLQHNAVVALKRGVSEFNDLLNSSSMKLRTAVAQGDVAGIQTYAITVDRAIISFDDTIHAIKMPGAARLGAQALITANASLEGILEAINFAAGRTEIANLYSQIQMAQSVEQTSLNQLASDLGLAPSLVITSITG